MKVFFQKGLIRDSSSRQREAYWANTKLGLSMAKCVDDNSFIDITQERILSSETISILELPGLEDESRIFLVDEILKGNYLKAPGIMNSHEALLYIIVNEAMHKLESIMKEEEKE